LMEQGVRYDTRKQSNKKKITYWSWGNKEYTGESKKERKLKAVLPRP